MVLIRRPFYMQVTGSQDDDESAERMNRIIYPTHHYSAPTCLFPFIGCREPAGAFAMGGTVLKRFKLSLPMMSDSVASSECF